MTLSGGTIGCSPMIRVFNRAGFMIWPSIVRSGFMINEFCSRNQKYVLWGYFVNACRIAGTFAQELGELFRS